MKIIIFSFFFSILIILNVFAETGQVESEKKNNEEIKFVKKISNQPNLPKWEYPGIKFQEYLQQNPLLEQDNTNQKQEISQHQHYPELKQYSIVGESKKLAESNDTEDANTELSNQPEKHNYNQSGIVWK